MSRGGQARQPQLVRFGAVETDDHPPTLLARADEVIE
jgi:hypothetical protein